MAATQTVTLLDGEQVTFKGYPWWLFWLPAGYTITLSPNIYTDSSRFGTDPQSITDLVYTGQHEIVHVRQQAAMGRWKFFLKYVFSRNFRYSQELPAYIAQFQWELDTHRPVTASNIKEVAAALSSWTYLWCVSEDKAIADITAGVGANNISK